MAPAACSPSSTTYHPPRPRLPSSCFCCRTPATAHAAAYTMSTTSVLRVSSSSNHANLRKQQQRRRRGLPPPPSALPDPQDAAVFLVVAGTVGVAASLLLRSPSSSSSSSSAAQQQDEAAGAGEDQADDGEECPDCGGTGLCGRCKGEGFVFKELSEDAATKARKAAKNMATRYTAGLPTKWTYCNKCSSTRSCTTCRGSGRIESRQPASKF